MKTIMADGWGGRAARRLAWGAGALVAALALQAQALLICASCGREARPDSARCAHCDAELPRPPPAVAAEPPVAPTAPQADPAAEVARLAAEAVAANLRQARELEQRQPEVALCYFQNALALSRLMSPDALPADASQAILSGNEAMFQALRRGQLPCRACKGSGRFQVDLSRVDPQQGLREVAGVACRTCRGQGRLAGFRPVAQVKQAIVQGRQEFERRQMVAGERRVGRVLMSAALEGLLTNRQRALAMTGMPTPCAGCQLAGRQDCSTCRATGWVRCPQTGCQKGVIEPTRAPGARPTRRLEDDLARKCPQCNGLAETPCESCAGSGGVPCRRCDGSGLAPRCARCAGTGLADCSRCKGTGEARGAPCQECRAEGVQLCSTCRGEGAASR